MSHCLFLKGYKNFVSEYTINNLFYAAGKLPHNINDVGAWL
jgi:hypothetical protein